MTTGAASTAGAGLDPRVERTRAVVLEATAALLAEDGFERITVEAIADRSGVARSTIYRNWPTTADLLVEAFAVLVDKQPPPDLGSLRADLEALGRELAAGLSSAAWGRALPSLISGAAHDPELARAQQAFSRERRLEIGEVFRRAADRGEIAAPTDPGEAAEAFAAAFFFRALMTGQPLDDAFGTTSPRSGAISPASRASSVLLPDPFGPHTTSTSAESSDSSTPSTARTPPGYR